jgi:hypothetical protein
MARACDEANRPACCPLATAARMRSSKAGTSIFAFVDVDPTRGVPAERPRYQRISCVT